MRFDSLRTGWQVAALALAALSGCASYTPRANVAEIPTLGDAYLFGRFHIEAPKVWLGMDGYQTMGFGIQCSDHRSYLLRFDVDNPVLAIKVHPSTCSWTEIVYSDGDGVVRSRQPAPPAVFKDVVIEGGYSYYLGDFHAEVINTVANGGMRTQWHLKAIRENFEITTDDMKDSYPNLRAFPAENRMLIRKEVPKAIPRPQGVAGSIAQAGPGDGSGGGS